MENTNKLYVIIATYLDTYYDMYPSTRRTATIVFSSKEEMEKAFNEMVNKHKDQYGLNKDYVKDTLDIITNDVWVEKAFRKNTDDVVYEQTSKYYEQKRVVRLVKYEANFGERIESWVKYN